MTAPTIPKWLIASILVTAVLSFVSIYRRYRVEEHNRAVSIAVEYETIESFGAAQRLTVDQSLTQLKSQGLSSVVLSEEYVFDLVNSGRVAIADHRLIARDPADAARLRRALSIRFPGLVPAPNAASPSDIDVPGLTGDVLRATPVGLNPDECARIRRAQLGIVARMANPPGVSSTYVRATLDWAHELGASVFLPEGDQVLGRRDALKDMTKELKQLGMYYASPEFSKMGGDDEVLKLIPESVVRLHSAQAAELDKLPFDEAVGRYSLAARERGMRILLVRPVSFASPQPLGSLDDFIKKIDLDCRRQGLDMGRARPFEDPETPTWLFLLIGLSIAPAAYFAGSVFVADRRWRMAGFAAALVIGGLAATHHVRPYTALLAAIVYPILAFVVLDGMSFRRLSGFPALTQLVRFFVTVSLISLVGGLGVAGLLNGLPYYIRAEQFEGVKLAVFLPIAVVALYFLIRESDLKALAKDPMTWGAALIALVILGALAFMSSRTGNDNPAGVSDLELKMRFVLDQLLIVRPRTKEFMIGHPLLIVGIGLLIARRTKLDGQRTVSGVAVALLLAGGAIAQTDIVNTMCHIHTPVLLSLMRIGVGMLVGCIIGLAVWAILRRWLPAGET
ncbi:MAG TPA: DUF5693 family protein [Fimbriimonadaceae bacterium]|nr:DUF5693 family protein [Fimbriimonadaceae bacterium]